MTFIDIDIHWFIYLVYSYIYFIIISISPAHERAQNGLLVSQNRKIRYYEYKYITVMAILDGTMFMWYHLLTRLNQLRVSFKNWLIGINFFILNGVNQNLSRKYCWSVWLFIIYASTLLKNRALIDTPDRPYEGVGNDWARGTFRTPDAQKLPLKVYLQTFVLGSPISSSTALTLWVSWRLKFPTNLK